MAVVFACSWRGLVVVIAAPLVEGWCGAFARAVECVSDVGADDFGDDVDDCRAGSAVTS